MHDLDHTLFLETDSPLVEETDFDAELEAGAESVAADASDFPTAFDDEALETPADDLEDDLELPGAGPMVSADELPFSEAEELELAAELLAVGDDRELDLFLGRLFRRARRGLRRIGRRLRPLGRILRPIAKRVLPIAGRALGTVFGGPAGGAIGGKLGSLAGKFLELELEGLAPEEQELEVARRFVRMAGSAARGLDRVSPRVPADRAAQVALARAVRPGGQRKARQGRWVRRRGRIVVLGV